VNTTVFRDVTPRSLVEDTSVLEEPIDCIFTVDGGSRFIRNAGLFLTVLSVSSGRMTDEMN
jgi:hypothetical protein